MTYVLKFFNFLSLKNPSVKKHLETVFSQLNLDMVGLCFAFTFAFGNPASAKFPTLPEQVKAIKHDLERSTLQGHENEYRTKKLGLEVFLKSQRTFLQKEYMNWEFKKTVYNRFTEKTGMSKVVGLLKSPSVHVIATFGSGAATFFFVTQAIFRTLADDVCGCAGGVAAVIGGAVAGSVAGWTVHQLQIHGWSLYTKSYTQYYKRLQFMNYNALAEEGIQIEGAMLDLVQQITFIESELLELEKLT